MTMVEATSNPFSSLKHALVDNELCPLAFSLISIELFSDLGFAEFGNYRLKLREEGSAVALLARPEMIADLSL
jgi:hypothetical protein